MSGDIGRGATRETIAFASELVKDEDRPYGNKSVCPRHILFVLMMRGNIIL